MGDYLKNGAKIGTCGSAYYATKKMLERHISDPEAAYYLDPKHSCNFAFPFPEYDGKAIGQISNFHDGERVDFFFSFPKDRKSWHDTITFHTHPKGGEGVNIQVPCVYSESALHHSRMYYDDVRFRLVGQVYRDGELLIMAECVYCGNKNSFDKEEAELIATDIEKWIDDDPDKVKYCKEIAKRIRETYNENTDKNTIPTNKLHA